jgi:hypothetical protein
LTKTKEFQRREKPVQEINSTGALFLSPNTEGIFANGITSSDYVRQFRQILRTELRPTQGPATDTQ